MTNAGETAMSVLKDVLTQSEATLAPVGLDFSFRQTSEHA